MGHPTGPLDQYLNALLQAFLYDMEVFSQAWLYYLALVPAVLYGTFFLIKWAFLTAPAWLPIFLIVRILDGFTININHHGKR